MADVRKLRFIESLPCRTTERETQESQSVEANETPPVKRLDGEVVREVMRRGETAFAGGTYCRVWVGWWEKGGGEVGREKVSLGLATSILLTRPLVAGLESISKTQCNRESAEGSIFADHLHAAFLCSLPRSLETRT